MPTKKIALYTTDTMADWEYAYITTTITTAEANQPGQFELLLVGDGPEPVTSLGGLPIQPMVDLADLESEKHLAALVIPGGNHYDVGHERLAGVVDKLLQREVPVAAICGATLLLARIGVLDTRAHTSNAPAFLAATGYSGGELYREQPVVNDKGVITAGGVHPIQFSAEVMRETGLMPQAMVDPWEQLHLTGDPQHFVALQETAAAIQ